MELSIVEYIFQNYSKIWGIPISIYVKGILHRKFERISFDVDLVEPFLDQLQCTDESLSILLTPKYLMYGMIKVKDTDIQVVAGPGRSVELDDTEIRSLIDDNNLSIDKFDTFKTYLRSIRLHPVEDYIANLRIMNASINKEIIVLDMFDTDTLLTTPGVKLENYLEIINARYDEELNYDPEPHFEFEKKLLFFIRNGMVDKIEEHLTSFIGRPTSITPNAIRQFKDRCISSTTLVSREAIKGGVAIDIAYRLFDAYCKKIEQCTSIRQLNGISINMIYDYSKRVHENQFKDIENPSIKRVINYINRHLEQKISVSIIADELNMSSGYLSYCFKKDTGEALSTFINKQKINEAKEQLQFTDKKLSEISNELSFTNQSYFQNVFRKYTGMTPLEYRQKATDKNSES
ncbi:MAG: helix-turn-helix domain-containing protein [Candidatus Izemoplasmataceae bacterium]